MTRHLVRFGLAVMVTLLALVVLWQFRIVVIYVLISLIIAAALRPLVNRLVGKHFLVRMAWILLYLVVLGCFGILLYMTAKAAINEIQKFVETISVQDEWSLPVWLERSSLQQTVVTRLPPPSQLITAVTGEDGQLVLPAIIGFSQGIGGVFSAVIVIIFLSLYWSINQIHFERLWLSLLPSAQRKQARGYLAYNRAEYRCLCARRGYPKSSCGDTIRSWFLADRFSIPSAPGAGGRPGKLDTRNRDSPDSYPGAYRRTSDQCPD